jgi:hypothetical protein
MNMWTTVDDLAFGRRVRGRSGTSSGTVKERGAVDPCVADEMNGQGLNEIGTANQNIARNSDKSIRSESFSEYSGSYSRFRVRSGRHASFLLLIRVSLPVPCPLSGEPRGKFTFLTKNLWCCDFTPVFL